MPVLATKLHVPEPRPDLVARSRLQDQLALVEHNAARLILISAPAGFGKTTVLTQWLSGQTAEVAWVSLDPDDNDVRRFLTHLISALQMTNPEVGREAQLVIDAGNDVPTQTVLASLVNDLDTLAEQTVVALDDYHEITTPTVHESLGFLLDYLPRHVRIAITTRSDPPFPLARLRSNGGLVELRAADLRFTADEAETLLNDVMGLALPRASVNALDRRTEGWAAGLQLAALSLRGRDDVAGFVDDFAGSHRFVLDYLIEEVLNRQPEIARDFLLETSVLAAMNASLCEAVTGRSDAEDMLRALERDNVFVVSLDDHREWYRYHHLFADALRARLRSTYPEKVADLHRAASRWCVEHGSMQDAVAHATASGDLESTADLIELALPELRRERRDDTMRAYVRSLPDDIVRRRALLATFMAWSRLGEGDLDGVEAWLDDAERALEIPQEIPAELTTFLPVANETHKQEVRELPAMIGVYRAAVAQARGDVEGTVAHARHALNLTEPNDHFSRGAAAGLLGLAAWAAGDLPSAVDTFSEAVASLRAAGNVADELGTTVVLASIWLGRGRPDEARRLYERALTAADRYPIPLSTTGDMHVGLADVLREQDELEAAASHLHTARELGDAASLPENRYRWFATQAGILLAYGYLDGALTMLERARATFQPGFFPNVRPIPAVMARLQIVRNNLIEAAEWARTSGVTLDDPPTYLSEFNQLTLARLVVAKRRAGSDEKLDQVLGMLNRILEAAETAGRAGSVIEARMVRALTHAADGNAEAATTDLVEALAEGVPVGYRRLFLDEGAPMQDLLRAVIQARPGVAAEHANRLLMVATQEPVPGPASASGVDEGLSDRELEVLHLLATDLTGPEIASHLFVSVNTLRTHTKHIFTKLGVNTRRAAVSRATDFGLL